MMIGADKISEEATYVCLFQMWTKYIELNSFVSFYLNALMTDRYNQKGFLLFSWFPSSPRDEWMELEMVHSERPAAFLDDELAEATKEETVIHTKKDWQLILTSRLILRASGTYSTLFRYLSPHRLKIGTCHMAGGAGIKQNYFQ